MRPFTRSCFLLPFLGRLFLLAIPFLLGACLLSLWCPLFFPHALSLIFLFLAKVQRLLTWTLSLLMIWYSGQTALFFFPFGKDGSGVLANFSHCGTEATLSFSAGSVCSSFSAEACAILHALCWSRQHQQVCHFSSPLLSSNSRSILSSIFPFASNFLADLAGTVFPLFLFYQATLGPRTLASPGNDAADGLARRGALLSPSAIPCSLSPLISRIHSSLFSDWRCTVSSKFFDAQVPSISKKELPRHTHCVLSRLRCNGHSFMLSFYLSRIGKIENAFCSACGQSFQDTSHFILHCLDTDSLRHSLFGNSLSFYDLWSRPWGVARLLGLHGLPPCPHPSEEVG